MNNSVLECSFCKQMMTELVVLDCCFASVCLKCIDKFQKQSRDPDENRLITCLKCFKKSDLTSKKPDIFLKEYMNFMHLSKKSSIVNQSCERCEAENEEMLYCMECKKQFCCVCNTNIHNIGRYKLHKRINVNNGPSEKINNFKNDVTSFELELCCQEHCNEKISTICLKDNKILCNVCQIAHNQICKSPAFLNLKYTKKKKTLSKFF